MESPEEKLNELSRKVALLINKLGQTMKENEALQKENIIFKETIKAQNEELKSFKNREKITKIVSGVMGSEEKSGQLKQKINEYIKEIDKCIAHLG